MDNIDKSKTSLIIYIFIILLILVGGFFLIHKKNNSKKNTTQEETYESIKISKDQDFVYFENEEVLSNDANLIYKEIKININSDIAKSTEKSINDQIPNLKKSVRYMNQVEMPEGKTPLYYTDNIYDADCIDYNFYRYKNKLVILTTIYTYDCFGEVGESQVKSYIFDLKTGNLLTEENILSSFNLTKEKLSSKVKEKITKMASEIEESLGYSLIKVEETLNNLNNPNKYTIYINNLGQLTLNIVVITNEINYNENIVIN